MRIAKVFLVVSLFSSVIAAQAFATDHTVLMSGDIYVMFFDPPALTITQGDRVRWQNVSVAQHTSTSGVGCLPNGKWATGTVDPGGTSAYVTFNTVGDFDYYCRFHCEMGMVGTLTVNAPIPTKPKTWGAVKALFATMAH